MLVLFVALMLYSPHTLQSPVLLSLHGATHACRKLWCCSAVSLLETPPLQHDCLNLKHQNHIQPIRELALNTSHGAPCVHKIKLLEHIILSGETGLSTYSHHARSDERCDGRRMRRLPGWEVSAQVPGVREKLLRYSTKNSKDCREVALPTEKSQSVWNRRVEPVCMDEGGRFGRGVWCCRDKTKWH